MSIKRHLAMIVLFTLSGMSALAQDSSSGKVDDPNSASPGSWSISLTIDGYAVPHAEFFLSPTVAADRQWVHLEARYNYEDQNTGSMWIGYNFSLGQKVAFEITPMVGGVFGNTIGIAPGYETSLSFKRLVLSSSGEYVFDTAGRNGSFFYSWPQVTYSLTDWFHAGLVAQRTKAYHTSFDTQRGFLIAFSYKRAQLTTFVFNPGWSDPTVVAEIHLGF